MVEVLEQVPEMPSRMLYLRSSMLDISDMVGGRYWVN